MSRLLDREILGWGRKSVREQIDLLWNDSKKGNVTVISYWEEEAWSSSYVIYASEPKLGPIAKQRAYCFVNLGRPGPAEILFPDDREAEVESSRNLGARDMRRLLEVPGVEERPELCDLLVGLGYRRDELDILTFKGFARHESAAVRYVVLGVLSWQPSVSNNELAGLFGTDSDERVRELAIRLGTGRTARRTRA